MKMKRALVIDFSAGWSFSFSGELIQLAAEGELRMTETNTPKSAKKPRWTSLEIGLITIVSLLFIVIVALIILFATQKTGEWCMEKAIMLTKKRCHLLMVIKGISFGCLWSCLQENREKQQNLFSFLNSPKTLYRIVNTIRRTVNKWSIFQLMSKRRTKL